MRFKGVYALVYRPKKRLCLWGHRGIISPYSINTKKTEAKTVEEKLGQFIDEMIDEKQLSGVTDEVRAQLMSDLLAQLEDQINAALVNALSPDKVEALNDMLDQEGVTDEQVRQFIDGSGIDSQRIAASTMLRFRDLYLGR